MKYRVTKAFQYAALTGGLTRKGRRERTLVRHDVGDVVELDDGVADMFYARLEPYFEKPKVARKPKPETDTRTFAEKLGFGKEEESGGGS